MRGRRLACGLLNGLVVTIGRVPAIVVTLGTMSVFRGFNSLWAGGKQISADQVPQAWLDLTAPKIAGVPLIVVIAVAHPVRRLRAARSHRHRARAVRHRLQPGRRAS